MKDVLNQVKGQQRIIEEKKTEINILGKKRQVSDICREIIAAISEYATVGDLIMQYNSGHAAIPWGVFSGLLQVGLL